MKCGVLTIVFYAAAVGLASMGCRQQAVGRPRSSEIQRALHMVEELSEPGCGTSRSAILVERGEPQQTFPGAELAQGGRGVLCLAQHIQTTRQVAVERVDVYTQLDWRHHRAVLGSLPPVRAVYLFYDAQDGLLAAYAKRID